MRLVDMKMVVIFLACFGITACSTLNTKIGGFFNMDTDLTLDFKVEANINPDDRKIPSPLFIRLYELKSAKQFKRANFIDLFERDKEVLGDNMIAKQRLKRLKPGESREDEYVLNKETRYVGLFAEFSQYKNSNFKVIIPVEPTNVIASKSGIHVSGNTITVNH